MILRTEFFNPLKFTDGMIVGEPNMGNTSTFITAGSFDSRAEAENCRKYLMTKFVRALLSVKKVTQHEPPKVWEYVPQQDFTDASDIDWSRTIEEIDNQLFDKYGLTLTERLFIRIRVKSLE